MNNFSKLLLAVGIIILFFAVRLPGIDHPYHQDEYKWPIIVNPALTEPGGIPHPPLGEFIYRQSGYLVGYDNFRVVPLFFGVCNLLLIFLIVRRRVSSRAAFIASAIFSISFFSVLASLMVDTDGQIMPFFMLLLFYAYDRFRESRLTISKFRWILAVILFSVLGLLVKVSFIIAIVAVICDFCWHFGPKKIWQLYRAYFIGSIILFIGGFVGLLFFAQLVFPFFNLSWSLNYWAHFVNFTHRNYLQITIQCLKSLLYISPLLVFLPMLARGQTLSRLSIFVWYIIIGLGFYLVPFDFSLGALDRYFQFLVIPLSVITGAVISDYWDEVHRLSRKKVLISMVVLAVFLLVLFMIQLYPHAAPPQHPKTEWFSRILSLHWNFVFPFSGGSGPLGFYISFLFMGLAWISCGILYLGSRIPRLKKYSSLALISILSVGLLYNLVFIEEYQFGKINGSAKELVSELVAVIAADDQIKMVTTYNDNGGNELMKTGKYRKRLYTDPQFNLDEKIATLVKNKEHYLVIDIPRMDPNSVYASYFASCEVAYQRVSGKITGSIYDCRDSKFETFNGSN
jgi:4-amino-4-deoxy-L-arabinose transferase-like glycosyltransferase